MDPRNELYQTLRTLPVGGKINFQDHPLKDQIIEILKDFVDNEIFAEHGEYLEFMNDYIGITKKQL
jgi:hypothetical protein